MRADRLLSILMLLQAQGRMSAPALARELDVSVRTIYRDIDALCSAGVPVYAESGPEGGYSLDEHYRTQLTGLNRDEAAALLLLSAPGPLDSLPVGHKIKGALRKVYAELPQTMPAQSPRLWMDWLAWDQPPGTPNFLEDLYGAVTRCQPVCLRFRLWNNIEIEQVVHPLGLVSKAGAWLLVYQANGKVRFQPVAELLVVQPLVGTFDYPPEFNLAAYWQGVCQEREEMTRQYPVHLRVTPAALDQLQRIMSGLQILAREESPDALARSILVLVWFETLEAARSRLLPLGSAVEVLDPLPLRLSLVDFARQVLAVYPSADL